MTSEAFEREYKKLNKAQKEAVDSIEGPVMVIAGPGSGKTQILSLRVANILLKTDARPGNVLCLTFTDSAAVNMRKRLSDMIGPDAYRVSIYTFHSFGTDLIERYPEYFYGGAYFSPADELAQMEVVEEILRGLSFDDPLRKEHPEQGFTYMYDIRQSVGSLKKAGVNPEEFKKLIAHNKKAIEAANGILEEVFEQRLSTKAFGDVRRALEKVKKIPTDGFPLPHMRAYVPALAESLERALTEAESSGKTEALSKWKSSMLAKDLSAGEAGEAEGGRRVLKDHLQLPKLEALADVYAKYQAKMFELGFFDYDDMLLQAIAAVESHPNLRAELQEQYQYVLVDEFQDTNDAQMRLMHLLLSAPVNEDRPNIMVVGDDDQAIYKFQGAQLSNILGFKGQYRDPKVVTLTHNYRSTQIILDIARFVIQRGEERLENVLPEIQKELVAANPSVLQGAIVSKTFPTMGHEYQFVSGEIKRLIADGESPEEIAVISRKHALLESFVPFLNAEKIPMKYERQSDVLREAHVRQLIAIARFISTLMRKDREEADHLMPEILTYPFWGLERQEIWKLSIEADRKRALWLEVMLESESDRMRDIANFLINLAQLAKHETVERIIDKMIGSHLALAPDTEDEDMELEEAPSVDSFVSPFKEYYFNSKRLEENKAAYLTFLSSLRVFIQSVREYKKGQLIGIDDLVAFVEIHEKNRMPVPDTSPFVNAFNAVNLLTAHKAKGLEFKTVFVLNCQNDVWAGRGPGRKLSFPLNLPISPAGDTIDDQLRLFYVAITRAKSNLYLSASKTTAEGRDALRLQFVLPRGGEMDKPEIAKLLEFAADESTLPRTIDALSASLSSIYRDPILHDEEALLRSLVENYQMSVTHMNNYLNVGKGGPAFFLEQNLIRFPQAKTVSSVFGSAMHRTIELIYRHLRTEGKLPSAKKVHEWVAGELRKERLQKTDYDTLVSRGNAALDAYLKQRSASFDPSHKIEVNFKNQGATLGVAHITGKIDKMVKLKGGEWSVHDFKTGGAKPEWEGKDDYEKVKLHQYKNQLVFYKLLVEHSRDFCVGCKVTRGCLEYLEPLNGRIVELGLDMEDGEEVERVKKLAEAVYRKIINLEFPDVSGYDDTVNGILAFEEDLLEGKI